MGHIRRSYQHSKQASKMVRSSNKKQRGREDKKKRIEEQTKKEVELCAQKELMLRQARTEATALETERNNLLRRLQFQQNQALFGTSAIDELINELVRSSSSTTSAELQQHRNPHPL